MQRPSRHLGLHHVALVVRDMTAARSFYVDLLGFGVEWEPDADNLYLSSGSDNLALHSGEPSKELGQLDHIGLIVSDAAQVSAWEQFLTHHDVEIAQKTKTHRDGATSCYVRDPDGILVQILHHPPISPALSRL